MFEFAGGVPRREVFGNATEVGRRVGSEAGLSGIYRRFAAHYGLGHALANPYSGNERGNVEDKVAATAGTCSCRCRPSTTCAPSTGGSRRTAVALAEACQMTESSAFTSSMPGIVTWSPFVRAMTADEGRTTWARHK